MEKDGLEEARKHSQAVHTTRDSAGYVMTTSDIQCSLLGNATEEQKRMLSPETGQFQLIGYAVPEKDSVQNDDGSIITNIQLCWGRKRRVGKAICTGANVVYEPPHEVCYRRTSSGEVEINIESK